MDKLLKFCKLHSVQDDFCSVGSPKLLFRQSHPHGKMGAESRRSQVISSGPPSHCAAVQDLGEGPAGLLKGAGTIIFLTPLSVIAERC